MQEYCVTYPDSCSGETGVLRIITVSPKVSSPRMGSSEEEETFPLFSSEAAGSQMKGGVGGQAARSLNSNGGL